MNLINIITATIAIFVEAGRIITTTNGTPLTAEQIADERAFLMANGFSLNASERSRYLTTRRIGRPFALDRRNRSELFDLILTAEDRRCAAIRNRNARVAALSTPAMNRIINGCLHDSELGLGA